MENVTTPDAPFSDTRLLRTPAPTGADCPLASHVADLAKELYPAALSLFAMIRDASALGQVIYWHPATKSDEAAAVDRLRTSGMDDIDTVLDALANAIQDSLGGIGGATSRDALDVINKVPTGRRAAGR